MDTKENAKRSASNTDVSDDITKEPESKRMNLTITSSNGPNTDLESDSNSRYTNEESVELNFSAGTNNNNSAPMSGKVGNTSYHYEDVTNAPPGLTVNPGLHFGLNELPEVDEGDELDEHELDVLENSSSNGELSSDSVDSNNGVHALSTPVSARSLPALDSLEMSSGDGEETDEDGEEEDIDELNNVLTAEQLLLYAQEQPHLAGGIPAVVFGRPHHGRPLTAAERRHAAALLPPGHIFQSHHRRITQQQRVAALSRRQRVLLVGHRGQHRRLEQPHRPIDINAGVTDELLDVDEDSKDEEVEEEEIEDEGSDEEEEEEEEDVSDVEDDDSELDESEIEEPVSPSVIRRLITRGAGPRMRTIPPESLRSRLQHGGHGIMRHMNVRPPVSFEATHGGNKRDRHGRIRSQRQHHGHIRGLPGTPGGIPLPMSAAARFISSEMYFQNGGAALLRTSPYNNMSLSNSNESMGYDSSGVVIQEVNENDCSPLPENIGDVSLPDGSSFTASDRSGSKQQLDISIDEIQPPSPMSAARAHYWKVDEDDEEDNENGEEEGNVEEPVVVDVDADVQDNQTVTTGSPNQNRKSRNEQISRKARFAGCLRMTVHNVSKTIGRDVYREGRKIFSESVTIRCLPWRILFMPRYNPQNVMSRDPHYQQQFLLNNQLLQAGNPGDEDNSNEELSTLINQNIDPFQDPHRWSLGFFVQCQPNVSQVQGLWSCNARAELRLLSQKEGIPDLVKHIEHNYFSKENDWGFTNFISYADLLNPEKGYIKDDTILLKARVRAEAPHGMDWDSKKFTGYVGLKNLGATCYLNSLMQAWFFTNKLRKAVYQIPLDPEEDAQKSIPLALQRLFYDLQFSRTAVNTKKLTRSFGWESLECYLQHDAQELCRVLLDNLEVKMRGGPIEDTIPSLFRGRMLSYIRCKHVDFESKREEAFYDVQLNVKGFRNVQESFRDYVTVETLDGDNRYDAGEHGLQEAQKGVIFLHFPPVLYLQLMRFRYDMHLDANVKVNDYFAFPYRLELDEFLQTPNPESPAVYILHAVLVHSGDNNGGHYVVYINPELNNRWFKFDDDVVSSCPRREAVEQNYGFSDGDVCIRHTANAYMLVYVRESARDDVLCPVTKHCIPKTLRRRLREERLVEERRRREKAVAHFYTCFSLYFDEDFHSWQGFDLTDFNAPPERRVRFLKTNSVQDLTNLIAAYLKRPRNSIRLWSIYLRRTQRVGVLDLRGMESHMDLYVEMLPPASPLKHLLPFDNKHDLLIFFKCFDPISRYIHYLGCSYHRIGTFIYSMLQSHALPLCFQIWHSSPPSANCTEDKLHILEREWDLFEERRPLYLHRIPNWRLRIEEVLECVNDGVIFVLQPSELARMRRTSFWLSSPPSCQPESLDVDSVTEHQDVSSPRYGNGMQTPTADSEPSSSNEQEQTSPNFSLCNLGITVNDNKESHNDISTDVNSNLRMISSSGFFSLGYAPSENATEHSHMLLSSDVESYMTEHFYMTCITFYNLEVENDPGFQLQLPLSTSLWVVARAVSRYLGGQVPPERLQFSCAHISPNGSVNFITLKSSIEDLRQIFPHGNATSGVPPGFHRSSNNSHHHQQQYPIHNACKLYYKQLTMSVKEIEALCIINAVFVTPSLQEDGEVSASLHCLATVQEFLLRIRTQVPVEKLSAPDAPLRLLEVSHSRILRVIPNNCPVGELLNSSESHHHHHHSHHSASSGTILRVEEIPLDERNMGPDEYIMFVSHVHKDSVVPFGVPFTVKVVEGEVMMKVRDRIRERLSVPHSEFQQWRFALVVNNRPSYFPDDHCAIVRLKKYLTPHGTLTGWLGIEHKVPLPKKQKLLSTERPIKIHN